MRDGPNGRGLSRKAIMTEIDDSLTRLGTDYVDLYQIHRWDYDTPIEETLEALHDVVKAGKARYIGASSMYAWQFAKALYVADLNGWTRFVSMQNHYNLLYREEEREMLPLCADQGIGVDPLEPAGPRAPDPRLGRRRPRAPRPTSSARTLYRDERPPGGRTRCSRSPRSARRPRPRSRWPGCSAKPGVIAPIVGATKPHHLEDAVAATTVTLERRRGRSASRPPTGPTRSSATARRGRRGSAGGTRRRAP